MELFSEIYSCYYQVVDCIVREAETRSLTKKEMENICTRHGFAESGLYILPKLLGGEWPLLKHDNEGGFRAVTDGHLPLPLTGLQRSWLKSLLSDSRFRLFFAEEELLILQEYVQDARALWEPEDFYYYDRYTDGDSYTSEEYRAHFQALLRGIPRRQYMTISYQSRGGNRITHHYLPLKLEYSLKNDRFRLLALPRNGRHSIYITTINVGSILKVTPLPEYDEEEIDFVGLIRKSYYREPIRLLIKNQRNALERAMLHFANYEKRTKKIDEDTWECLIYYNNSMETELLIEILSFGPAVKVTGPESFLAQVKNRLQRQIDLMGGVPSRL
ncbi:MAG TPA: WYL domain-containing protein [Lachnospiraceae bacterium]|nr:WYL domain-containing protein [Lachnospiraceae bacterium]